MRDDTRFLWVPGAGLPSLPDTFGAVACLAPTEEVNADDGQPGADPVGDQQHENTKTAGLDGPAVFFNETIRGVVSCYCY